MTEDHGAEYVGGCRELDLTTRPIKRLTLRERGMITIEYAIGAVLVLVLVGVIIASIQQGWFQVMVKDLVAFLMEHIRMALG